MLEFRAKHCRQQKQKQQSISFQHPTHSFPGGPREPLSIVWGGMPLPRAETLERDDSGRCGSRDDNVLGLPKIPPDPVCGTTT